MSDGEIDDKLIAFRGPISTVDEATNKQLGKILINLEDEDVDPDHETYWKLLALAGGIIPVIIFMLSSMI